MFMNLLALTDMLLVCGPCSNLFATLGCLVGFMSCSFGLYQMDFLFISFSYPGFGLAIGLGFKFILYTVVSLVRYCLRLFLRASPRDLLSPLVLFVRCVRLLGLPGCGMILYLL